MAPALVEGWESRRQVEFVETRSIRPSPVERAVAHLSSPLLDRQPVPDPGLRPLREDGPPKGRLVRASVADVVPALLALPLVLVDWRWAAVAAGTLVGGRLVRRFARRAPFGFGDGFVAFRAELGWPRGVQEDDDLRWSWPSSDPPRPPGRQPAETR